MVLKRLLITALGALGLGALAAGPTFAQQIPAPDAYGDPQACAAAVKLAKAVVDKGEVQDNGLTPIQQAALTNMARACPGDVGGGIKTARTLYNAAVETEDELDKAQKRYDDDDSARNLEKLEEAQEDHDEAVAARNAHSGGGAIYESVFIEEDRLTRAKAASSAFTKAEAAADTAQALRDTVELENYITDFAGFDTTGQAYEYETYTVITTADTDATDDMDDAVYTTYVRVKKQGGATVGPQLMVDEDGDPVLDGDGDRQYEVPTLLSGGLTKVNPDGTGDGMTSFVLEADFDHDLDATTDGITFLRVQTATDVLEDQTIGGVDSEYKMAKNKLAAVEKTLAANQDGTMTLQLTEDVRRAQAQYDFFAAQRENVYDSLADGDLVVDRMGDNPATPNEVETTFVLMDTPYTVEDYEALTDLQEAETDAADALKDAYDARVAASDDLEDAQRDTESYLEQLVVLRQNEKAAADATALKDEAEEETAGQKTANENLANANAQLATFNELQALDDDNPVKALVNSLVAAEDSAEDDDGQALVDAIDATYQTANDALTAVEGLGGADGTVAKNSAEIGLDADGNGLVTLPDGTMGSRIDDHAQKLALKKMYIDNLGAEIGFDPATGMGTGENGMSRIDTNEYNIAGNTTAIMAEQTARMEADTMLGGRIDANAGAISTNVTAISSNADAIAANMSSIGSNAAAIGANEARIGELSNELDIVRSGVAASMALAGMPAINGRGIAIGVGSFDGESAFAVGFQIQGEMASFQIGVTSSGGETGASAGVGFQF